MKLASRKNPFDDRMDLLIPRASANQDGVVNTRALCLSQPKPLSLTEPKAAFSFYTARTR
jgi:hypothetical protein